MSAYRCLILKWNWYELNVIESKTPLTPILKNLKPSGTLTAKRLYFSNAKFYYNHVHKLLYKLHHFLDKYFVSIDVSRKTRGVHVILLSTNPEPIDNMLNMLSSKQLQPDKVEKLDRQTIIKLVDERRYSLLDYYLKLALRKYLFKKGYTPKKIGGKTLWSRMNSNVLYSIDSDIDSSKLKGYISVDVRITSSISLWDKMLESNQQDYWKYIGNNVIVPYGEGYAYGKIHDFVVKKVSETIYINNKELNLLDYYRQKNIEIDPEEKPIVAVEIIYPELRDRKSVLYYPPSQVKLILREDNLDPNTRYNIINEVLTEIIKDFKLNDIGFIKAVIKPRHKNYVNIYRDILLKYGNKVGWQSPLYSMQKLGAKPLHGALRIPRLIILLPRSILKNISKDVIDTIGKLIQEVYKKYNLGIIENVEFYYYSVSEDPNEQKIVFSNILSKLLENTSPDKALIMPVVNHRYLFRVAKQLCSDKYFHARIVDKETIATLGNLIIEYNIGNNEKSTIQYLNDVQDKKIVDKQLISIVSNLVFSIYIEYLLQNEIYNHRIPSKMTWALANPADGNGKSLYIGYDISRSKTERGEVAVAFVLYDPYGHMLNAVFRRIQGERISGEIIESILLSLFKLVKFEKEINRLVIYKDGGIRGVKELNEIISVFNNIGTKRGLKYIDIVGVAKRHNLRLFTKNKQSRTISNPNMGVWIKIWNVIKNGVYTERALLVASETKIGGTVKPVILEKYSTHHTSKSLNDLVNEYIRLCRLNFWNPLNGMNKLPLPILMADKLAYLALQGVQIRTP